MAEPWITVCVALYNRERWVPDALRSVQAQTDPDWELLVVDDGSTDAAAAAVERLAEPRLRLVRKPHTGCWDTKNRCLAEARTPWVMFLDSDDVLAPGYLAHAHNHLRPKDEYIYPSAVEIAREDLSPTGSIWRYAEWPDRNALLRLYWQTGVNGIPHAGAVIRRALFDRVGSFDASLANLGDMHFTLRNALRVNWRMEPHLTGYRNRQHQGQTNRSPLPRAEAHARALAMLIELYPPQSYLPERLKTEGELLHAWVNAFMQRAAEAGDYGEPFRRAALPYLRRLREVRP